MGTSLIILIMCSWQSPDIYIYIISLYNYSILGFGVHLVHVIKSPSHYISDLLLSQTLV